MIIKWLAITTVMTYGSFTLFQYALAVLPSAEIYNAFGGGPDLKNGGIATARYGSDKVDIYFAYGGADDNDHVIEFRCSIDGSSFLKSNCTSEEDERRTLYRFPDGVMRLSYVKNGETFIYLPIPSVPLSKIHTFGVKILNDNGELSSAATFEYKIRATNPSNPGHPEYSGPEKTTSHPPGHADVTVEFNSITIHNNHEGFLRGSGEWDMAAYVQGRRVMLTDATTNIICGGNPPPVNCYELWNAENGQTYYFKKGNKVTVDLPRSTPISIFTVGVESDGCGRTAFPEDITGTLKIFDNPQLDWYSPIQIFQKDINKKASCGGDNEILGLINKIYPPPGYQAGPHTSVGSSSGDYTIRYTITVTPKL